ADVVVELVPAMIGKLHVTERDVDSERQRGERGRQREGDGPWQAAAQPRCPFEPGEQERRAQDARSHAIDPVRIEGGTPDPTLEDGEQAARDHTGEGKADDGRSYPGPDAHVRLPPYRVWGVRGHPRKGGPQTSRPARMKGDEPDHEEREAEDEEDDGRLEHRGDGLMAHHQ